MKKLTKILLVNWLYYSKQVIELKGINFITGKNSAGKSTVIDALQIVLLGDTNSRNFNRAANEKSQRSLDGYLYTDKDSSSPNSRRGKDFSSYIACEFWDDVEGTKFVTGIIFDCHNDGSYQSRFFIYDGVIPENCFIEDGEAIEISQFRNFLRQTYGARAKIYDSQKQYRADVLAKWNVHNEQVFRMMKKAISFKPIDNIQTFITENICDIPEKLDIESMQQSIREYKRSELLAKNQEEKLETLKRIECLYNEANRALAQWTEHNFVTLWSQKELAQAQVDKVKTRKKNTEKALTEVEEAIGDISTQIGQKETRRRELELICSQSDVFNEEKRLTEEKQRLINEQNALAKRIQSLALEIRREASLLENLCRQILSWEREEPLITVLALSEETLKTYEALGNMDYEMFALPLSQFEATQEITEKIVSAVRNAAHKIEDTLSSLNEQRNQKRAALDSLRKDVKDYPKGLISFKTRLSSELEKGVGHLVQMDILADVLEIADEHWRGAVEGYMNTQKFYLLVDPDYYNEAVNIYDHIKTDFSAYSYGIVDIGKLRKVEEITARDGSLAKKIG